MRIQHQCAPLQQTVSRQSQLPATMHTETLSIGGMACSHCVRALKDALQKLPGVKIHEVALGHATLSFDVHQRKQVHEAITSEGYTIRVKRPRL